MTKNIRKVGSINNSTFGDNTNFQGDDVRQSKIVSPDNLLVEEAFKELFSHIKSLNEDATKEQAEFNAEALKESIEAKDKNKGQKLLKFLVGALGVVEPLATIAQISGIPIPNLPTA